MATTKVYTYEIPIRTYIQEVNISYTFTLTYKTNTYYGSILPEIVVEKLIADLNIPNKSRIYSLNSRLVAMEVNDLYQ